MVIDATLRPHRFSFQITRENEPAQDVLVVASFNPRHASSPAKYVAKAKAYSLHNRAPHDRVHTPLVAITTRRFNADLRAHKYDEAFAIHLRPQAETNVAQATRADETNKEPPDKPDQFANVPSWLRPTLEQFAQSLLAPSTDLPPDQGKDNLHIDLVGGAKPIFQSLRALLHKQLDELKRQLDKLLGKRMDSATPKSPWGASVVFAAKKDGRICVCWDYRGLNSVTKKDLLCRTPLKDNAQRVAAECFYDRCYCCCYPTVCGIDGGYAKRKVAV